LLLGLPAKRWFLLFAGCISLGGWPGRKKRWHPVTLPLPLA
jgi:hypothetical protein